MAEQYYIMREVGSVPEGPYTRARLHELYHADKKRHDFFVMPVTEKGCAEWLKVADFFAAEPPCPPTYMLLSIISVVCCFPFSLVALNQSNKVSLLHWEGRFAEAERASRTALRWNLFFLLAVVVLVVLSCLALSYTWHTLTQPGARLRF